VTFFFLRFALFKTHISAATFISNDARSGGGKKLEGFVFVIHESFAIVTRNQRAGAVLTALCRRRVLPLTSYFS
jgi:hypothetical protein